MTAANPSPLSPIQSDALTKACTGSSIKHGFFSREGGVSKGIYEGLNVGVGSNDNQTDIAINRARVADWFGVSLDRLFQPWQVHSPDVAIIENENGWTGGERPKADAVVTKIPDIAIGIVPADCGPVLYADPQAGIIGAAHAGWKGALSGAIEATLNAMETLGADRSDITAAIGPAIQQDSYEVGTEFRDTWVGEKEWTDRFIRACSGDRLQFDLTGYVQTRLLREGVGAVDNLGHDTCAMEETYFSNRRRNHRGEDDYGRNGSVIMLES